MEDSGQIKKKPKKTKPRQFVRPLELFSRQEACERLGRLLGRSYTRLPRERSADPGAETCPGPIPGSRSAASTAGTSPATGAGRRPVPPARLARAAALPAGDPSACHSPAADAVPPQICPPCARLGFARCWHEGHASQSAAAGLPPTHAGGRELTATVGCPLLVHLPVSSPTPCPCRGRTPGATRLAGMPRNRAAYQVVRAELL